MKTRQVHRTLGLILLLPFFAWAATGLVFFIKPGYGGAYDMPAVKTYPLTSPVTIPAREEWLEYRVVRTVLGEHLMVRTESGWSHLDPRTLKPRPRPQAADIARLLNDAFLENPERYGRVADASEQEILTTTGVRVKLYWDTLSLSQRGTDTVWIDRLYKIHYIQWTGIKTLDQILGLSALAGIVGLSLLGLRLFLAGRKS